MISGTKRVASGFLGVAVLCAGLIGGIRTVEVWTIQNLGYGSWAYFTVNGLNLILTILIFLAGLYFALVWMAGQWPGKKS